jgi:hypothetical protein
MSNAIQLVEFVKWFPETNMEMGFGYDRTAWFVYCRYHGESEWDTHCGPYSTSEHAREWILAIRETKSPLKVRTCPPCGGSGSLPNMTCCPLCGGGGKVVVRAALAPSQPDGETS